MIAAVFFGSNRLYEIEGTVPASNPDALWCISATQHKTVNIGSIGKAARQS